MNWKLTLSLLLLCASCTATIAQTLSVTYPAEADTTGMDGIMLLSLEKQLVLTLNSSGASSDTLVIEVGPEAGSYDLLQRKFPLSQTGTFDDGCFLESSTGDLTVGLGTYTGLATFHVRAYLASTGESSAVIVSSE